MDMDWKYKKNRRFSIALIVLMLFFSPLAFAHKASIFAWLEGNTVNTESYFSNGKKAQHSAISVYTDNGRLYTSGKTDKQGKFSFTLPADTGFSILTIRLEASDSHKAEFKLMIDLEE